MDITKYLTKKDIELSNDDINIEKLEKDLRKGYVLSSEVDSARKEALKENTEKYAELESKYNNLEKTYNDLQEKNVEISKKIGEEISFDKALGDIKFKVNDFDIKELYCSKIREQIFPFIILID